jgi:hypothetical protein
MKRSILFALISVTVVTAITAVAQQNPSDNPLLSTAATAPATPDVRVVGKQGWITLKADTKFGDTLLKAGVYYVQHEVSAGSHGVAFQRVGDPVLALQYSDEGTVGPPVTAQCRLESLPARVKRTTITTVPDGIMHRIAKIEIKGENVAHIF